MNRSSRLIAVFALLVLGLTSVISSRSIIEKRLWYLTVDNNVGQARFWTIYLGAHDLKLTRRFPGDGEIEIDAAMNFQFVSSGYIEGNGASLRGRVSALPQMLLVNDGGELLLDADSIDYIYDFGEKVVLLNGQKGDLIINAEGNKVAPNRFQLREFQLVMVMDEEVLSNTADETNIQAVSFSKEGIERARKANAALSR